jgi:type IV pilus assembly protein PilV
MSRIARRRTYSLVSARGFTLIEVMIAVLVLAIGLLGFALLQTMNVRFTQSANYRTQATNLAYDLLDQMRANRLTAADYAGALGATFAAGSVAVPVTGCVRPIATVTVATNVERWECQVVEALGAASSATVTYAGGIATVTIRWDETRVAGGAADPSTEFEVVTRL